MPETETPEETRRWRVDRISYVLARGGHPAYEMDHHATSPCSDPVRQAGFLVQSREADPDCVYAEWIDHFMGHGKTWRRETDRLARTLRDAGYAVEGPMEVPALWGFLRVTRPAGNGAADAHLDPADDHRRVRRLRRGARHPCGRQEAQVSEETGGHRAWRITRDGHLQALSAEARAEALAATEQAELELRAEPGAPKCGHCGRPRRGYGFADGADLCHTGTLPPDAEPADCYRLVTVYQHAADGSCCRSSEAAPGSE